MTNVEYHGCLLFQGDRTNKDPEEARNVETAEGAGSKKLHANAAKRNSNKFSPKLEEIQEEARKRVVENKKKSSPTFEIPPSLDSGIVTRSVSSHSQSNDDDYNDQSDDDESEMTRDNTETEDDEEFLSKSDMKMFGKGRGRQKPSVDEEDIVSDIYSTAFSKVPKVGHDLCVSVSQSDVILLRSCPATARVFTP